MWTETNAFLEWHIPQDWVDQGMGICQDFQSSTVHFFLSLLFLENTDLLTFTWRLSLHFSHKLVSIASIFSTQKDKACGDEWVVTAELCCRVSCALPSVLWWVFVFTSFRIYNDSILSAFPQCYPLHMKVKSIRSVELISYWVPEDK